ncbi:hypothetical protein ASPACDRAFT_45588 [Aspergillus aculeatus ATCC 16872]|uniref:F-box domain-containing protein n=1 Tax=Aspergillus aculeatus (strain ATCC 16872 / CBS 172.66 / WB 5094) TaxID=690307 RepID=A0A1L9WMV7_ASPA1|nr:uncharacterized protein ASPACDRAFT_45588 [Aspergillus aculeatus ATCC 16872]OJJ97494.1 hypothetical protein ASPACDRAFT_45588 [Aspergillus aculeatus ATCC 16872]
MAPATDGLSDSDDSSDSGLHSAETLDPEITPRPEASRIFFIPEILELTLVDVDMYSILMSTRVCSVWKDLIETSPKIRRALLFAFRMIQSGISFDIAQFVTRHFGDCRTTNLGRPTQQALCLLLARPLADHAPPERSEFEDSRLVPRHPPWSR